MKTSLLKAIALGLLAAPTFVMAATCAVNMSPGSKNLGAYMCAADTLKGAQDACGSEGYSSCDEPIKVCVCKGKPSTVPVGLRPGDLKANSGIALPPTQKPVPPAKP